MPSGRRVTLYLLLLVVGYWVGLAAFPEAADHDKVEAASKEFAPEIVIRKLDGKVSHLSEYRGQWVFLNFWATWCPPCLQEMPTMETFYRKFKSKNLTMIAVSVDKGNSDSVTSFIKEHNFSFEVALDPDGDSSNKFGVYSLPTTFIINPKGEVVSKALGGREWTDPVIVKYFNDLLKKN